MHPFTITIDWDQTTGKWFIVKNGNWPNSTHVLFRNHAGRSCRVAFNNPKWFGLKSFLLLGHTRDQKPWEVPLVVLVPPSSPDKIEFWINETGFVSPDEGGMPDTFEIP